MWSRSRSIAAIPVLLQPFRSGAAVGLQSKRPQVKTSPSRRPKSWSKRPRKWSKRPHFGQNDLNRARSIADVPVLVQPFRSGKAVPVFVRSFPLSSGHYRFRQAVPVLVRPFSFSLGRSRFRQAVPVFVRPFPFSSGRSRSAPSSSLAVFPVVTKNKRFRAVG
ncbi:hypothetical protein DPMN_070717 [Dreissena polymorpha]|uniref:Uncharacterized protein n=1 Tax=Dreissena polymorpha TaxID=45954 RepID=A0A9D4BVB0_DREPO|nr:hypothetical protein DPMN_070717 [Dreissena polymorpha]